MKKTVKQAKEDLEKVRKHHDSRIAKIESQIKAREESNLSHDDLDRELAQAEEIKNGALRLSQASLDEAKAQESERLKDAQAKQKADTEAAESKTKAQAKKNYLAAGGKADEFESAWNNGLRDKVLESAVVNNKEEEKPVTVVQRNGF